MEFLCIGCIISGIIGAAIGSSKNNAGTGFILGALLGPIGWIITALSGGTPPPVVIQTAAPVAALAPTNAVPCPHCRTMIDPLATVCSRCLRDVPNTFVATEAGFAAELRVARTDDALNEIANRAMGAELRMVPGAIGRLREIRDARRSELLKT